MIFLEASNIKSYPFLSPKIYLFVYSVPVEIELVEVIPSSSTLPVAYTSLSPPSKSMFYFHFSI